MSDLLPLVVAALNDNIAVQAQEEITKLREELDLSQSVEIVRAADDEDEPVVVYASGLFQKGEYDASNPNLWQVDLESNEKTPRCRLADLRDCIICVGGGFQLESLDDELRNRAGYEGFFDADECDGDNAKAVSFCFCPNTLWLTVLVHGWPREEWEAVVEGDRIDPEEVISFLVETVASRHPETTVEFKDISFTVKSINRALARLLPPRRKEEVRAERDGRETEESQAYSDLFSFVGKTMRNLGNRSGMALFLRQMEEIMALLSDLDIQDRNDDNEEAIITLVTGFERLGGERLREIMYGQIAQADDEEITEVDGNA